MKTSKFSDDIVLIFSDLVQNVHRQYTINSSFFLHVFSWCLLKLCDNYTGVCLLLFFISFFVFVI